MNRWIVLAGVSMSLMASAMASAQERLALRAVGSMTDSDITRTALVGAGVGIDVGEFFEVVAEGAIAPGVDYPPVHVHTIATGPGAGIPTQIVLGHLDQQRVDRYVLGGVRLLPPTETFRPFGEFTVGWNRQVRVEQDPSLDAPESFVSTGAFVSLGGGVEVRLRSHAEVFAGYRYARDTSGDFAFHTVHGGIGWHSADDVIESAIRSTGVLGF